MYARTSAPGVPRPVDGGDVVAQVGDAVLVVDGARRVRDDRVVGVGRAVLGDQERQAGAAMDVDQELLQAGGVDLPADVGARLADHEPTRVDAGVGLRLGGAACASASGAAARNGV